VNHASTPTTVTSTDSPNRTMSIRLIEGMPVQATDREIGEIEDVIIDPVRLRVTHLVVQTAHRHDQARLIPIAAIASCDDHVTLSWSAAEVEQAPRVEETEYSMPGRSPRPGEGWDVGTTRVLSWPYYGAGGMGLGMSFDQGYAGRSAMTTTSYDRIPAGTAELRRASEVVSSDEHFVGHVDGSIIDPDDAITHVIVERGHLWGHREVTIPMHEVESVSSDRVRLSASRDEISGFRALGFHRQAAASPGH
jgi:uncharacterized protein YrrD